jgi:hypothetical protein
MGSDPFDDSSDDDSDSGGVHFGSRDGRSDPNMSAMFHPMLMKLAQMGGSVPEDTTNFQFDPSKFSFDQLSSAVPILREGAKDLRGKMETIEIGIPMSSIVSVLKKLIPFLESLGPVKLHLKIPVGAVADILENVVIE